MLDRIDMHLHLPRVNMKTLQSKEPSGDASEIIKQRVAMTRQCQVQRQGKLNSQLSSRELEEYCELSSELLNFLAVVCERLNMSARAYHRILKLARTIADMADKKMINKAHISEAIGFRSLDRK
jgi:magnesium chelatase family protein